MNALATLFIVAVFGYSIYHYAPKRDEHTFCLERFHPRTPMSDRSVSYYEDQRRYSDLAAIYSRRDVAGPDWPDAEKPLV
ncbi:hypothetical protein [Nocardia sp. Marseille-Q1738]